MPPINMPSKNAPMVITTLSITFYGGIRGYPLNKRILGDKIQCLLQHKTLVLCWVWVTVVLKYNLPKKKEQEVIAPARDALVV